MENDGSPKNVVTFPTKNSTTVIKTFHSSSHFEQEVCILRMLISIHDDDEDNDVSKFFVLPFHSNSSLLQLTFPRMQTDAFEWLHCTNAMAHKNVLFQKKSIARQMGSALALLVKHQIEHFDIKLENILLTTLPTGQVVAKLTDFEFARHFQDVETENHTRYTYPSSPKGTVGYMAPEIAIKTPSKKDDIPHSMDVYSLSVTLLFLFYGVRYSSLFEFHYSRFQSISFPLDTLWTHRDFYSFYKSITRLLQHKNQPRTIPFTPFHMSFQSKELESILLQGLLYTPHERTSAKAFASQLLHLFQN